MNSRTAKGIITGKWGLKSGSSRAESDLGKYKQESSSLRKSAGEDAAGTSGMPDPERNRLLEVRAGLGHPDRARPTAPEHAALRKGGASLFS